MTAASRSFRQKGRTIGFVPTMGFLHEGHLSLMDEARRHADILVVSIFVNPTQFDQQGDLDAYPRDMDRDLSLCRDRGVNVVFTPGPDEMYPPGSRTWVEVMDLTETLCGATRPGHFRGVTTVVSKLFHIVEPDVAVFGEKDYQQLAVIRQMVRDLDFAISIVAGPTVREQDGLAMSSRNARLRPEHRQWAPALHQALCRARDRVIAGEKSVASLVDEARQTVTSHPDAAVDYIEVVHPRTLKIVDTVEGPVVMALAVKIGGVRLIDNMILTP